MIRCETAPCDWNALADRILAGTPATADDGLRILESHDDKLLDLVAAAYRVRRRHFGNTVQLYFLMNAKSGLCPEDCGYCSQSKIAETDIPRYNLLSAEHLLAGAREAFERQSKTYCIVISARGPNEREIRAIEEIVPRIKHEFGLSICACLGLLTQEQANRLKACGVDRVNHNLNTGRNHYEQICTTHTYEDRLATLHAIRKAGLEVCSGGIIGMGESKRDLVEMALELRGLEAESVPINFLNPIDGTPLQGRNDLDPRFCLKVLCMFRMMNPESELRIAGGRELHLRSLQPLGLYVANSVFVGDYLTTKGQLPDEDYRMIRDMGLVITRGQAKPLPEASPLEAVDTMPSGGCQSKGGSGCACS